MVAFEEFARPALLALSGRKALRRLEVSARLESSLRSPQGKTEFVRAHVRLENGEWRARVSGEQGSGRLSTMTGANALLVVPPETSQVAAGEFLLTRLILCAEIE
jgi:molybdopterin biosynthesis enzyme